MRSPSRSAGCPPNARRRLRVLFDRSPPSATQRSYTKSIPAAYSPAVKLILVLFLVSGCRTTDNAGDASTTVDQSIAPEHDLSVALLSRCGHPGDTGNSLGVGQF